MSVSATEQEAATRRAEQAIQGILLRLAEDTGKTVDQVNVDTRRWANCTVEIFLR